MKKNNHHHLAMASGILAISILACRPVITVGWGEILIVVGVALLVIGPLAIRFIRRVKSAAEDENDPEK